MRCVVGNQDQDTSNWHREKKIASENVFSVFYALDSSSENRQFFVEFRTILYPALEKEYYVKLKWVQCNKFQLEMSLFSWALEWI